MIRSEIIKNQDFKALFWLTNDSDFCLALMEILFNRYKENPNSLSPTEFNLFLCYQLENASQADSILSFLQEYFPEYKGEVVKALHEVGAEKSAKLIQKAIKLLPEDGSWFYDTANPYSQNKMNKIDNEFSSYPDGKMCIKYRKYAEEHQNDFQ